MCKFLSIVSRIPFCFSEILWEILSQQENKDKKPYTHQPIYKNTGDAVALMKNISMSGKTDFK